MNRVRSSFLFVVALLAAGSAYAETTVPLDMQVDLLRKVVRFERTFVGQAGTPVALILAVRGSNASSERAAAQLGKAIERDPEMGGRPVRVTTHHYVSAEALKKAVLAQSASLVYFTPGFEDELSAIAAALAGVHVITISTDGDEVDHGAVLGFELVSAHPKIALNLAQARKQGLDFNSDLLRLARVVK